jgi:hypothetical protein
VKFCDAIFIGAYKGEWMIDICKVLAVFLMLSVGGCASLSQSECISADWYDLGVHNALEGQKRNYVAKHFKACSEYQITPDLVEYKLGWMEGVQKFCTAQSAWYYGLTRHQYQNTCSINEEKQFLPAYRLAKKVLAKRSEINEHRSDLRRLNRYLYSDNLSDEQRSDNVFDRMDLKMDINFLEMDLMRLERQAHELGWY